MSATLVLASFSMSIIAAIYLIVSATVFSMDKICASSIFKNFASALRIIVSNANYSFPKIIDVGIRDVPKPSSFNTKYRSGGEGTSSITTTGTFDRKDININRTSNATGVSATTKRQTRRTRHFKPAIVQTPTGGYNCAVM